MSVSQYAYGVGAIVAVLLSAGVVGISGRRFLTPRWGGALGALVALVVAYSFLVVVGEVLGTFGWFSRGPLVATSVAVAVVVGGLALRRPKVAAEPQEPAGWSLARIAATFCAVLVVAQGLVALRATMNTGNTFIDATEYHLTWAAHFATSHRTTGIIQISPGTAVSYYPLNDELLHAWGIALLHRDSLSLLLGIFDVLATLLAAWCVGSVVRRGPLAVCAIAPLLVPLGPFTADAVNDWTALWPFIAVLAIALRLRADGETATAGQPLVAGLAAGLAIGTKLSLLAPTAALLGAFLLIVPRGRRSLATLLVVFGALVSGVYWYVRNAVAVGSPLPSQHIPGLPEVPFSTITQYGYSVAHYFGNSHVLHHFFIPGLHFFFGPAWAVIVGVAAVGVVLALVLGPAGQRLVAVVAVIASGVYVSTPTSAFGPAGTPYLFGVNLRYLLPALVLGLLLLVNVVSRWKVVAAAAAIGLTAVLSVTEARRVVWDFSTNLTILAAIVATALVAIAVQVPAVRRHARPLAGLAAAAVLVAGYPVNQHYLDHRYREGPLLAPLQDVSGQRIGIVGLSATYPYLGATYDNTAQYIGFEHADHAFTDYSTCSAWRAAVGRGRYNYVVVETSNAVGINGQPPALGWTSSDPEARSIVSNANGAIFAIGPGFAAAPCIVT